MVAILEIERRNYRPEEVVNLIQQTALSVQGGHAVAVRMAGTYSKCPKCNKILPPDYDNHYPWGGDGSCDGVPVEIDFDKVSDESGGE